VELYCLEKKGLVEVVCPCPLVSIWLLHPTEFANLAMKMVSGLDVPFLISQMVLNFVAKYYFDRGQLCLSIY
jgi:hypothetical protein